MIARSVAVLLTAVLAAISVDWLFATQSGLLRVLLTGSALAAGLVVLGRGAAESFRRGKRNHLAREVDGAVPRLQERWSTVTELSSNQFEVGAHPAMVRQVSNEAVQWEPRIEPSDVVSPKGLVRAIGAVALAVFVYLDIAIFYGPQLGILIQRFCSPLTPIPFTQVTSISGDAVVARGDSLEISAQQTGRYADEAILFIQPFEGENKDSYHPMRTKIRAT